MSSKRIPNRSSSPMWWAETVMAFADSDMSYTATARKLFVHRNTIMYRMEIIKAETGLNPGNFYDLIQLVGMAKAEQEFGIVQCDPERLNGVRTDDFYLMLKSIINRMGLRIVVEKK